MKISLNKVYAKFIEWVSESHMPNLYQLIILFSFLSAINIIGICIFGFTNFMIIVGVLMIWFLIHEDSFLKDWRFSLITFVVIILCCLATPLMRFIFAFIGIVLQLVIWFALFGQEVDGSWRIPHAIRNFKSQNHDFEVYLCEKKLKELRKCDDDQECG